MDESTLGPNAGMEVDATLGVLTMHTSSARLCRLACTAGEIKPMKFPSQVFVRPSAKATMVAMVVALVAIAVRGQEANSFQSELQRYFTARASSFGAPTTFSFGVYSDIHMIENPAYGLTRIQWQRLLSRWRDDGN